VIVYVEKHEKHILALDGKEKCITHRGADNLSKKRARLAKPYQKGKP